MAPERNKKKLIQELKKLIKNIGKNGIPVKAAYLFGSYAHGNPKEWSDVDLLIVSNRFSGIRFYDVERLLPLTRGYNNLIELHPLKSSDFKPGNLFIREILTNGIRIK